MEDHRVSRFPSLAARLTRRAAGAGAALLLATALAAPARAQTVPVRIGYIPIIGAARWWWPISRAG
jgi:ABC-type nitrate/sulfonate/bicarbonate transport system substrate-binding protein